MSSTRSMLRAANKEYNRTNDQEKYRTNGRMYYEKNKEILTEGQKARVASDPEKYRMQSSLEYYGNE